MVQSKKVTKEDVLGNIDDVSDDDDDDDDDDVKKDRPDLVRTHSIS